MSANAFALSPVGRRQLLEWPIRATTALFCQSLGNFPPSFGYAAAAGSGADSAAAKRDDDVNGAQGDLTAQAIELLKEWGPAHAGPKGGWVDLKEVTDSSGPAGWVVTGEHPDVLAYVRPDEGSGPAIQIGLTGRMKRDKDSKELQIVHVEDKR